MGLMGTAQLANGSFGGMGGGMGSMGMPLHSHSDITGGANINGGGGGGYVSLQDRYAALLEANALLPTTSVIGDAAYVVSHDFTSCAVFRPADRSAYNDEWRRVPLACDSIVTDMYVGGAGGGGGDAVAEANRRQRALERLQRRREAEQRRAERRNSADMLAKSASSGTYGGGGVVGRGGVLISEDDEDDEDDNHLNGGSYGGALDSASNTVLFESPQLPLPGSVTVPFFHPNLKEVLITVGTDNRIFGCCVAPRPMQGYAGGCWKYVKMVGIEELKAFVPATGSGGGFTTVPTNGPFVADWAHVITLPPPPPPAPATPAAADSASGGVGRPPTHGRGPQQQNGSSSKAPPHEQQEYHLYVKCADRHFTVPLAPLLEVLMEEHAASRDVLGAIAAADDEEDEEAEGDRGKAGGGGGLLLGRRRNNSGAVSRTASAAAAAHNRRRSTAAFSSGSEGAAVPLPEGAVPATAVNLRRLAVGCPSRYGGTILDDAAASLTVRVSGLRSAPPTDRLVHLSYPGVAYTTHAGERRDLATGEVFPLDGAAAVPHDAVRRQQQRIDDELQRIGEHGGAQRSVPDGVNIFAKYSTVTRTTAAKASDSGERNSAAAAAAAGGDEELGEYYFDYTTSRYVRKKQNVRNRNIAVVEPHTWVWLFSPAARNFIPWQRLDGVFDPLTVTLHNHLSGPEELATLAGDTFATFFFSEQLLTVSRDLGDPRRQQEFLKVCARVTVREAPHPRQVALYEKDRDNEAALRRSTAAGSGTRLTAMHIREQMLAVKAQRLAAAQRDGRRALAKERHASGGGDDGEGDDNDYYNGHSNDGASSYMGKVAPRLLTNGGGGQPPSLRGSTVGNSNNKQVGSGPQSSTAGSADADADDGSGGDPFVAAARALAVKPLTERAACDKALPRPETSLHIKAMRREIAFAIPMTNRRAAIVAADFSAYVVVELDRYAHAKKYRGYASRGGQAEGDEDDEELEL